jgi:DnaJ-domain-containing protein 1
MSDDTDDLIIRHLRRQEWPLTSWLFGSIQLDQRYFDSNPNFQIALQGIEDIETVTHFNHDDPALESDEEDSEELTDTHYRLTIRFVRKFKRVRASTPFALISGESGFLILTPVRYWSYLDEKYSCGDTKEIGFELFYYAQKLTSPRSSDEILQETWKHATKSGDRDMRYKDNINAYLVQRYGATMLLKSGPKWELAGLLEEERDRLVVALEEMTGNQVDLDDEGCDNLTDNGPSKADEVDSDQLWREVLEVSSDATRSEVEAAYQEKMKRLHAAKEEGLECSRQEHNEPWYEVLGLSPDSTEDEIKAAHKEKIKQYHPDRVSGLGEKLRAVAEIESQKLNAAREEGLASVRGEAAASEDEIDQSFAAQSGYEEDYEEPWYDVLGVDPDAASDEIEAAYYKMMDYYQLALRLAETTNLEQEPTCEIH